MENINSEPRLIHLYQFNQRMQPIKASTGCLDYTHAVQSYMKVVLPDAELLLLPKFFSSNEADLYLEVLRTKVTWTQEQIKLYGKTYDVPRLTAWYGDVGKIYTYSGIRTVAMPWTAPLLEIKSAIEQASLAPFNSVLLNYYRSGLDGVSWHSDDEPELGKNPIIASVS
ncbi:Alkylated DNA repair protein-like protein [Nitrosococcus halophilus Nc 4]|uniref:Alkylated DNA repair protein-like protein n=1 Tax=Nitrosococcus halophilus (strain Nc4) TaxID=472759 RepID=D5BUR2_NITHN|nr:alpha-ketoglutarate-dependent dioxygenase AlkB [Nitrosococcus halophilus]ADE13462.1 Alkylated DNA repair protein-like protein [Nitrosococcus halophilus Nc 4]